uniref:Uncharacterized protein n=1 Tax=Anopheles atroparvus TaxID=41427 RepID=A0A182J8F0_ANOAO
MPCSAVTLSLATISAIIAVALLAIAFSTDNWQSYEVKRTNIQPFIAKHPDLTDSFNNRLIYYTRTRGLFRYCYPKERPPASSGKCNEWGGLSDQRGRKREFRNHRAKIYSKSYLKKQKKNCHLFFAFT